MEGQGVVRFRLNTAQDFVLQAIERQMAEKRPVRVVVLKARRMGITTFCQALMYAMTSTRKHTNTMVCAQDDDSVREIFRISKLFHHYDERRNLGVLPVTEQSNERALRFASKDLHSEGLMSSMLVETSEGSTVGRGLTLHGLHGSEVAYWKNPDVLAGLEVALTKAPNTLGIMESTANGVGGIFYDMFMQASQKKSDWEAVFLPWTLNENNQAPVTEKEFQEWEWDNSDERDYSEKYKLTMEQVKWRRVTLASPFCYRPGMQRVDVFRQEYPIEAYDAFVASGRNFFLLGPLHTLRDSAKGIRDPSFRGDLRNKTPLSDRPASSRDPLIPVIDADPVGPFHVWEEPQADKDYVVGADVAEGLMHGDDSVAVVIRRDTLAIVAKWRGRKLDPDEFGHLCALVGTWYNRALVGIEINGPGITANLALRKIGYGRCWFDRNIETLSEVDRDRVGWRTTPGTRIYMLQGLETEIREGTITIPSSDFFEEADRFINISIGNRAAKPQAQPGYHDDEVMATAIALQLHLKGGAMYKPRQKSSDVVDFAHPKVTSLKKKAKIRVYGW